MARWVVIVQPPQGEPTEVVLEPGYGLPDFDEADALLHAGLTLRGPGASMRLAH